MDTPLTEGSKEEEIRDPIFVIRRCKNVMSVTRKRKYLRLMNIFNEGRGRLTLDARSVRLG
jgi:hypothetical protein